MTMESPDVSSQAMLDQMLHDGKISDEDYIRLSKAMAIKPSAGEQSVKGQANPRRLYKSRRHRLIGGVCAGLAEYFGIDVIIVRILAIVSAFLAGPFTLLLYLLMYFLLPWDEKKVACEPQRGGAHPLLFAFCALFLVTIMPLLFSVFLLHRFIDVYSQLGAELPALTRGMAPIVESYYNIWGALLSLVVVAVATGLYTACCNKTLRLFFVFAFFLWAALFVLATYYPFISISMFRGSVVGD